MDNRKFEQLIDMIINEEEDKARALFHDIVVEKSREIYESIMEEEALGEMGGASGQFMDEIADTVHGEEVGMSEEEEDEFTDIEVDGEMDDADFGDEMDQEDELEDRVVDLEDKLDMLMAEFEELMGQEDDMGDMDGMDDENFGDEEDMMEAADEEDVAESKEEDDEEMAESLEEAISLKQVPGLYGSKIGGDNGSNSKSVALTNGPRVKSDAKPVNFSGESSSGGTKGGLASPDTKDVEHASQWKNRPSQGGMNLDKAPKAHTAQASGTNTKSPVAESKVAKKRIK